MRLTQLFGKQLKQAPAEATSVNHKLLVQGGFIEQLSAGVYTYLPLGWRVLKKIADIVREEMNATGAQEMFMPALHPKSVWEPTGRWESARDVMYQFRDHSGKDVGLAWTHEELVAALAATKINSYRDLPVAVYQIQTKFRHELRAKSGLLRGRELMMKDLYSFHTDEADREKYYEKVKHAYMKTFTRCGIKAIYTRASGGAFSDFSDEFQTLTPYGEDLIYYCPKCDYAENREITKLKAGDICPNCKKGKITIEKSIEVGNIFPLGTRFTAALGVRYLDKNGKEHIPTMASYGMGVSRLMGTIVEVHHDERGIIWPESVAPYSRYLVGIGKAGSSEAAKLYEKMTKAGTEVLFDDRDVSPGESFATADLLGIPNRVTVSDKTLAKNSVELKDRTKKEPKLVSQAKLLAS